MTFLLNTNSALERCLKILAPDNNIGYKICVGLLARFYKLFNSILNNLKNQNYTATNILIRPLYETGLSLEYMIVKWRKENFEEFILTDAMRQRNMIKSLESIQKVEKKYNIDLVGEVINKIKKEIEKDKLNIDKLPNCKLRSWHRKLTYKKMATELGEEPEAIFKMVYSSGNFAVHTSWTDIKKFHIKKDKNDKNYLPNVKDGHHSLATYSFLICTSLRICQLYAERFGNRKNAKYCEKLHKNFHKDFIFANNQKF